MGSVGRWMLILLVLGALAGGASVLYLRHESARPRIPSAAPLQPLKVVVTVAPLRGLIEPLLPEGSTVTVLMQPGKSEHGYEFTPADMAAVAKADLVLYIGLGLEGRLEATIKGREKHAAHKSMSIAEALGIDATPDEGAHADDDDHAHGTDPHLWLDPALVEQLIPKLEEAIILAYSSRHIPLWDEQRAKLHDAALKLAEKVTSVDREWKEKLAPLQGRALVTHHNAFSRPAQRYGFKIAAVIREFETSEPSPGDIAKVVDAIRNQHVTTIFVEPQFSPGAAERIAALAGVKVGRLDPLGDGDWFKLMRSNLDAIAAGLADQPAPPKPGAK